MRTAIFTTQKTALTIQTTEKVRLEQMGSPAQVTPPMAADLTPGAHQVTVGAGVFKIVSGANVAVTGDAQTTRITSTANDKDGGWPDTTLSPVAVDANTLHAFFAIPDARSI